MADGLRVSLVDSQESEVEFIQPPPPERGFHTVEALPPCGFDNLVWTPSTSTSHMAQPVEPSGVRVSLDGKFSAAVEPLTRIVGLTKSILYNIKYYHHAIIRLILLRDKHWGLMDHLCNYKQIYDLKSNKRYFFYVAVPNTMWYTISLKDKHITPANTTEVKQTCCSQEQGIIFGHGCGEAQRHDHQPGARREDRQPGGQGHDEHRRDQEDRHRGEDQPAAP